MMKPLIPRVAAMRVNIITIASKVLVPLAGASPSRRIVMGVIPTKSEAKKTPIIAGFFPNRFETAGARPNPHKGGNQPDHGKVRHLGRGEFPEVRRDVEVESLPEAG